MSAPPRSASAGRVPMTEPSARTLALVRRYLEAQGCTCSPVVTCEEVVGGLPVLEIEHDPWCAVLRRMRARDQ